MITNKQPQHRPSTGKLTPLGRATEQTKGDWGAYREEAGSIARFGQIP